MENNENSNPDFLRLKTIKQLKKILDDDIQISYDDKLKKDDYIKLILAHTPQNPLVPKALLKKPALPTPVLPGGPKRPPVVNSDSDEGRKRGRPRKRVQEEISEEIESDSSLKSDSSSRKH